MIIKNIKSSLFTIDRELNKNIDIVLYVKMRTIFSDAYNLNHDLDALNIDEIQRELKLKEK